MMEVIMQLGDIWIAEDIDILKLLKIINNLKRIQQLCYHLQGKFQHSPNKFLILSNMWNEAWDLKEQIKLE